MLTAEQALKADNLRFISCLNRAHADRGYSLIWKTERFIKSSTARHESKHTIKWQLPQHLIANLMYRRTKTSLIYLYKKCWQALTLVVYDKLIFKEHFAASAYM